MTAEPSNLPENTEFKRRKISLSERAVGAIIKNVFTCMAVAKYGIRDGMDSVRNGELVAGMIEGAIIGSNIAHVDPISGQLIYEQGSSARLVAYDVNRTQEFPSLLTAKAPNLITKGSLWSFMPEELKGNPASMRTPTGYVEVYNINHLMTMDTYPLAHLMGEKILQAVTMAEAFDAVGLSEYIPGLESRRIAQDRVYQVTPKGNTLTVLVDDGGDKTPRYERRLKPVQVPGLLAN